MWVYETNILYCGWYLIKISLNYIFNGYFLPALSAASLFVLLFSIILQIQKQLVAIINIM